MSVAGSSPVLLDGDEWKSHFRNFESSAFRLEVHQQYTMPKEADSVRDFTAGEPRPGDFNTVWHQTIRNNAAAGRTMTRAKIVHRPLTNYTKYLLEWAIPGNVAAGEDYRILDLTDEPNPGLPEQDFWMFDERIVVHLNYRDDGTQINRELIQDPDIGQYLAWRDLAVERAVPFSAYRF
ncbi:hypothetical protein OG711_17625 [Streptomyces uncialis]|nr:hypothetical protein [Streptomyces uncialis]WTE12399.1 hypothetical protein OG924_20360 [Streptomyces uncialis]